jgi:hypothetical protein
MRGQVKIDQMYAYIVMDDDNTEGIPAYQAGNMTMPMVGADEARIESLNPIAQQMATGLGKKVTLVRFSVREEMEVFEP